MTTLGEVSSLITELERWLPRARAVQDRGDGLRSPNLEGHVSGGGTSDPVGALVESSIGHSQRLDMADLRVIQARKQMTNAYALTHHQGLKLKLHPTDHLGALAVLTRAVEANLPTTQDPSGLVEDRIEAARRLLHDARGICQGVVEGSIHKDDWETVITDTGRIRRYVGTAAPGCASCARIIGPDDRTPFYSEPRTPGSRLCLACENVNNHRRKLWEVAHPAAKGPTDPRRFWPPLGFIRHLRDHGHVRATPGQWAQWDAEERALELERKKRKKRSA